MPGHTEHQRTKGPAPTGTTDAPTTDHRTRMSPHLTLHAAISRMVGWGRASPPKGPVRLELRDPGQLTIFGLRRLRDRELLSISIGELQLNTNTAQVMTGGGFVGGGVGITGAVAGMATAKALNAVSRQRYEHTLLIAHQLLPNGARREITFTFATLSEAQLRDQLTATLTPWADSYIATITNQSLDPLGYGDNLQASYDQIDRMRHRGVLDDRQALTLASHTSRPFIAAILGRLDAHQVPFPEAQQIATHITALQRDRRVTTDQARQVQDRLLEIPAPPTEPATSRIAQLQALAELRKTGALTEPEFQAEKARILQEPQ